MHTKPKCLVVMICLTKIVLLKILEFLVSLPKQAMVAWSAVLIVQKHVWDQLFTVDTIWNIGETGDINTNARPNNNQ